MNGEIPPEVGNLNALEQLVLNHNCLYGTMPSEIGMLSRLQYVNLQMNGLSGYIPHEFYELASLAKIELGEQADAWWNCTSRDDQLVDPAYKMGDPINDNNIGFEGMFLEQIEQLQNLVYLDIYGNSFSGSIASEIGILNNLGTFDTRSQSN
jgi:Leucine-rich repeat (LRR) protein